MLKKNCTYTAGDSLIRPTFASRRSSTSQTQSFSGPAYNEFITAEQVRLIDQDGENQGVMTIEDAQSRASDAGLDLVEISPNTNPPVCKILDIGKYKYEAQKKAAAARKNQKVQDVKEIKLRPGIDHHDYAVKLRSVLRFIEEGDKVRISLRFRGREMAHSELGLKLMERMQEDTSDIAKVELAPKIEGKQMLMVIVPK